MDVCSAADLNRMSDRRPRVREQLSALTRKVDEIYLIGHGRRSSSSDYIPPLQEEVGEPVGPKAILGLVEKWGKESDVIYLYGCEVGANARYCQTIANEKGWTVYAPGVKVCYCYV